MCQRCLNAVNKYFPNATEETIQFVLWEKTAYPMGSPALIERQVAEYAGYKDADKKPE